MQAKPVLHEFNIEKAISNKVIKKAYVLPKDTDGDGIKDSKDACPNVWGLKKFKGCPDSDNDGIEDSKDYCPNISGLESLKGCPDSDGDGFSDYEDLCPNLFGLEVYNGCPDTDRDGVMDSKDDCPTIAGPIENRGCPGKNKNIGTIDFKEELETDDSNNMDKQPVLKINQMDLDIINDIVKGIEFKSASTIYNKTTSDQLDAIVLILKNFPNAKWYIEGYTDSIGRADNNLTLSQKRANSVRDYLVSHGLNPENFTAIGYGEKKPIDTNMYEKGRANNRRVEFKLVK